MLRLKGKEAWFKELKSWLCNAWSILAFLVSIPLVFFCVNVSDFSEQSLRVAGTLLQLCAIDVVAYRLKKTTKMFGDAYPIRVLLGFPSPFLPKPVSLRATGISRGASISKGRASARLGENATNEDKLLHIEAKVDTLQRSHWMLEDRVETVETSLKQEIHSHRKILERDIAYLDGKLSEALSGESHHEWIAIFWLIIGVILAGFAPEIAP